MEKLLVKVGDLNLGLEGRLVEFGNLLINKLFTSRDFFGFGVGAGRDLAQASFHARQDEGNCVFHKGLIDKTEAVRQVSHTLVSKVGETVHCELVLLVDEIRHALFPDFEQILNFFLFGVEFGVELCYLNGIGLRAGSSVIGSVLCLLDAVKKGGVVLSFDCVLFLMYRDGGGWPAKMKGERRMRTDSSATVATQ